MDDIYREIILDHYKNPRNFGKLDAPSGSFSLYNSACGDKIEIEIEVKSEIVKDIKFRGEGCAISMASASLLTENVIGKSIEEIKKMERKDILKLLGTELTPSRLKCALLPLEVLHKALDK